MKRITFLATILLIVLLGINGIGFAGEILGAGATFPFPLYSKMFDVYNSSYGIKINYQAIGSGGGIKQLISKTVDFGASDAFLSNSEMKSAPGHVLHIPICSGAVVITYNLPGDPKLKFTSDVIADIFMGKIKKWNDPRIVKINPGLKLDSTDIIVAHRSDGSGTSYIFTDYLSKVSKTWASKVGTGKSVNWPIGLGGKGNAGVTGLIKQNNGSMGYVELIYALENNLSVGTIRNKSGNYIYPTISATSAASSTIPADTRVSLTNTSSPNGYPLAGFTWILAYKEQKYGNRTLDDAKKLSKLMWWMVHEGQKYAQPLKYSPLSVLTVKKAEAIIKSMTYGGKKIL